MSVNAINSVSKSQVKFSASFNLPERKTGMSPETKALIGLSALGATIAGGVLVKKTIDANKISALAKRLLKKPETFDLESVKDIAVGFAKAGIAVGADGLFIETHENPAVAKSDGANMLRLDLLEGLLTKLVRIREAIK